MRRYKEKEESSDSREDGEMKVYKKWTRNRDGKSRRKSGYLHS